MRRIPMVAGVLMSMLLAVGGCRSEPEAASTAGSGDPELVAMLPDDVRDKGKLTAVMGAAFPPEHFMENGKLVGFNPDMANAIGALLGLQVELVGTNFEGIIPGLQARRYDLGVAAMFVTEERQRAVDFVTYFDEGSSIMTKAGSGDAITGADQICGHRAALEKGTAHVDEMDDLSRKCVAAGKPAVKVQTYAKQSDANTALLSGQADFLALTSPAAGYAAKQNPTFKVVAEYASYPAGIVLAKGRPELAKAVHAALERLIADGSYRKILTKWGMEQGAIDAPEILSKG